MSVVISVFPRTVLDPIPRDASMKYPLSVLSVMSLLVSVLALAHGAEATILGQMIRHPSYIFNAVSVIIDPTMRNLATSAAGRRLLPSMIGDIA